MQRHVRSYVCVGEVIKAFPIPFFSAFVPLSSARYADENVRSEVP
jgi:hypothetical protein